MRRVAPTAPRVARSVALAAATAALAFATSGPGALFGLPALLVAAVLAVPFFEWSAVPAPLAHALPRVVALVLFLAGLLAWLSRSVGALVLEPAVFPRVAGPVILAAAVAFSLAPRAFSVGRALAPAIIGLIGVAGLDPAPEGYSGSALPFLRASEHTAFAERYIVLAVVVMLGLWTSAVLERGPRFSRRALATLGLSAMVVVALTATGVVGLPLLQPHAEKAFASVFTDGTTGLGGGSTLGEFAELAVSRRRVLDLETSLSSPGEWRLPSEVFVDFDGRRWTSPRVSGAGAPGRPASLLPTATSPGTSPLLEGIGAWFEAAPAGPDAVELRVTQAEVGSWPLLLPRGSVAVTAAAWLIEVDPYGLLRRPPGDSLRLYGALWSEAAMQGRPATPEQRAEALTLPQPLDPRTLALARQLAATTPDPEGRVKATLAHLHTGYRYALAPGPFRTDDPLAEFLFEKRAGYCEYFASAAVILLRLQDVPARFVKGLAVGPHTDQGGGLHVVRESDAHAWVEVSLPGQGWTEIDPTPPGPLADSRGRASALRKLAERLRAMLASAWTRLTVRGPVEFLRWLGGRLAAGVVRALREPLAWLALAVIAFGPRLLRAARQWWRRAPLPPRDPSDEAVPPVLRALVRDLERSWAAAGHPRPQTRGLLEHALHLARTPGTPPPAPPRDLAAAGSLIVAAYYRVRFGGEAPSVAELSTLRASRPS